MIGLVLVALAALALAAAVLAVAVVTQLRADLAEQDRNDTDAEAAQ